uniref:RICIN domain-containing protein n=1 Tax=Roseihalotalea indica TaxID=2867963 RepID=A0AA49GMX8_9BACT|nr:RICIN domain-containing protein [Tunicatimonas sp. TK19036]
MHPKLQNKASASSTKGHDPGKMLPGKSPQWVYHYRELCLVCILSLFFTSLHAQRHMEDLDRGVVAVRTSSDSVFVSWRLFGKDPADIAFNLYRGETKVNPSPITDATNYTDNTSEDGSYTVRPVIDGQEQAASAPASVWANPYQSVPLQQPPGGTTPDGVEYTYRPNDVSVGDLDGDGAYELVLKWDPTNAKDNSQSGYTGNVFIDAYELDGTQLWRIDLGVNIRAGAHYTQFIVYDLDSDGKAEVAFKTADGTTDGVGTVIGNAGADYRNDGGYILYGPEYLTIFNGATGAAMATTDYIPPRGRVGDWGDDYGNRVDRFLAGVGYFDGEQPSLLMTRGYYTRSVLVAWDWRNGQLSQRWVFDSDVAGDSYAGQGNHQLSINDVDGDGRDEVVFGAMTVDDDGSGLYTTELGHGDAMHVGDLNPEREGQEIWSAFESPGAYDGNGLWMRDAATGEKLWGVPATDDVGRAMTADIDPRYPGYEAWGARGNLYTVTGEEIGTNKPSMNFGSWWDGDLQRELLDGPTISKWNYTAGASETLVDASMYGAVQNNGTKANPGLSADIMGDWREEAIYSHSNNSELLIFTTTIPTSYRFYTLMHDPQYRVAIAWQNVAYNQPPHTSFYLGEGMDAPPIPNIALVEDDTTGTPIIYLAASEGDARVDLSWSVTDVELSNLEVYRDTDPDPDGRARIASLSGSSRTYSDTTVLNDSTYYYWIKGKDADGNVTNSNSVSATPREDTGGPQLPGIALTVTAANAQLELNWEVTLLELTGIDIMRDTDPNPSGRGRIASIDGSARSFNDTNVQNGITYYYWVKATDTAGSVYNSNEAHATAVVEDSSGVANVTLEASAGVSQVALNWIVSNIDVANQEVYRDTDPDPNGRARLASLGAEINSFTDTTALNDSTYYYWIKVTDVNGGVTNSDAASATPKAPPSVVLEASGGEAQVELNWVVYNTEVTYQEVYRDLDDDPSGRTRIGKLDGTARSYVDSTAENGITYYYWIKARDTNGENINSNAASATPILTNPEGFYVITARHSGKVLDTNQPCGDEPCFFGNVIQKEAGASNTQVWMINPEGNGYYSIINVACDQAMSVSLLSKIFKGSTVFHWGYLGLTTQQWEINNLGDGYFSLINRFSGQAVSVHQGSISDGANVKQSDYTGADYQQFSLTVAPASAWVAHQTTKKNKAGLLEPATQELEGYDVPTVVYPNPSAEVFTIETGGAFAYQIVDQLSRVVERGTAERSARVGEELSTGVYIISIEAEEKNEQFKLIKQ